MMQLEYWERARALFDDARAMPVEQRAAFLDDACADAALRAEVDALLRAHTALENGPRADFLQHLDARCSAALLGSTAVEPPDDLAAGETLGRYRIVRRLGHGGMGVVYLAKDLRLDRPAAVKLLPRHLSVDGSARRRFEEEARAASALDHPNIVTVYEIGDAPDGRLFIAMAFCEGETLREVLEAGPPPISVTVTLATQIADGLAAAHQRGIVHRDIKPRNIIVTAGGIAKIVDFGIAKVAGSALTQSASTPGTVAYMSPEQTRGGSTDPRVDVWAVGVLLYELLAGRRPFQADQEQALIYAIRNDEPEPIATLRSDVPSELSSVVERCMRKDPAERYPDAAALVADLRMLSTDATQTTETSLHRKAPPRANKIGAEPVALRSRAAFRLIASAAAVVLVIAIVALVSRVTGGQPGLEVRRVAVAPFENRTGAAQHDELTRMAGDWIAHGLWQTGFIEVVPLAAFTSQQGTEDGSSARALANEAGARLLVTAALYREGDVLRLQGQITDVVNGRLVGSVDPIDAPLAAPLEGVAELRHRIQAALYPALDTQITHIRAVQRPPRFEAYSEYLAGRESHVVRDLPNALRHFQHAAALDSTFVLPHVLSATILNTMGNHVGADSIIRWLEQDRELDQFSRAHVTWLRGILSGDLQASYAGMREAARYAPGSTLINAQLASETVRLGRPRKAIDLLYSFEPERGELSGWFGYWQVLVSAHHLRGDHRRELKEAQRARRLYGDDPRAAIAELQALAALGRTKEVERLLDETTHRPARGEPNPGALMLNTALELRAHAPVRRPGKHLTVADRILERAIAWYQSKPLEHQSVRERYELTMALAAVGRRVEARKLLVDLANAPASQPAGPSPFSPRLSPNFPDQVAYHGSLGVLAALDADAATTSAALTWLGEFRDPYARGRPTYWRAAILAAQGEREKAVALLRQAFNEGVPYSLALHNAPELASLRDYKPFQALVRPRD